MRTHESFEIIDVLVEIVMKETLAIVSVAVPDESRSERGTGELLLYAINHGRRIPLDPFYGVTHAASHIEQEEQVDFLQ